jgi:hypothetical protein
VRRLYTGSFWFRLLRTPVTVCPVRAVIVFPLLCAIPRHCGRLRDPGSLPEFELVRTYLPSIRKARGGTVSGRTRSLGLTQPLPEIVCSWTSVCSGVFSEIACLFNCDMTGSALILFPLECNAAGIRIRTSPSRVVVQSRIVATDRHNDGLSLCPVSADTRCHPLVPTVRVASAL